MRNLSLALLYFATAIGIGINVGINNNCLAQTTSQSPLPPEAQAMMSKLVGTWTSQGKRNGESYSGLAQVRWNESRTGLTYQLREGNKVNSGVSYWDFKSNELVETWPIFALTAVQRYKVDQDNPQRWIGNAWLQLYNGQQVESSPIEASFGDNQFTFTAESGSETLTTTYTRVALSDSQASFRDLGEFLVGGTWVSDETPPARHRYEWREGKKLLMLDRQSGRYPGLSLVTIDHQWQCVRFIEVDNSGMLGSAVVVRDDQDHWRLFGRYESEAEVQDLQIKITRVNPDEILTSGIETINGTISQWQVTWKRVKDSP